ncbi:MAG: rhomboid family intramembrane serine protease [Sulfolobales archaeon]
MGGATIKLGNLSRYLFGLPTGILPEGYEFGYPKATVALILANVAVYIISSLSNMFMSIGGYWVEVGSYIPILLVEDPTNIYRVFTSMFLHGDILHIFFNMYFLYIFGRGVENSLGSLRFVILYFISGILATVFHTAFSYIQGPYALMIPALGASGAISGVLAAYLMFYPGTSLSACWFFFIFPVCFTVRASYWLIFWFATQVIYGYSRLGAAVAFFAHAGGFVAGIALLPILVRKERLELLRGWRSYGHIFNIIFREVEAVRGLGRTSKLLLSALIASLIAGSAVIASDVSQLTIYVAGVSGRAVGIAELNDSIVFTVVNNNVEVQTITNTYTRILINRLVGLDLMINKSASSSSLELINLNTTSKLRVRDSVVNVPTYIESLRLNYDDNGVLKEAYGSFKTVIVSIMTNTYRFGDSITYEFRISVVGYYDASKMVTSTALTSLATSTVALAVVLFRDRELTIVG